MQKSVRDRAPPGDDQTQSDRSNTVHQHSRGRMRTTASPHIDRSGPRHHGYGSWRCRRRRGLRWPTGPATETIEYSVRLDHARLRTGAQEPCRQGLAGNGGHFRSANDSEAGMQVVVLPVRSGLIDRGETRRFFGSIPLTPSCGALGGRRTSESKSEAGNVRAFWGIPYRQHDWGTQMPTHGGLGRDRGHRRIVSGSGDG